MNLNHKKIALCLCLILVTSALGVYIRWYPLHLSIRALKQEPIRERATYLVYKKLMKKIEVLVETQFPDLDLDLKKELIRKKSRQLMRTEKRQISDQIRKTAEAMQPQTNQFLLGADPYYFLLQVKRILKDGGLSKNWMTGRYFNPLQTAPYGSQSAFYLHPHVGWLVYEFLKLWRPNIDLMKALSYVPLILYVFVVAAFFVAGLSLGLDLFATFIAAVVFSLAPIFVQRSALGWFDTDPYNCLFPLLILTPYFWSTLQKKYIVQSAIVSGIMTGLHSAFWAGWPYYSYVLIGIGVCSALAMRITQKKDPFFFKFVGVYFLTSVIFVVIFSSPIRFYETFLEGFIYVKKYETTGLGAWPNVFLTVDEAQSISWKRFIALVAGHYGIMGLVGFGAVIGIVYSAVTKSLMRLLHYASLVLITLISSIFSLQTERFSILVTMPFYLVVAFGLDSSIRLITLFANRFRRPNLLRKIAVTGFLSFVMLTTFPHSWSIASFFSGGMKPLMDDVWYSALMEIKNRTEENAIINCWWPPGHFITGIAERRTLLDGANQHLHQNYWIARVYFASDEREAIGLLRMINLSGNEAPEYLLKHGFLLHEAVPLIAKVVTLNRTQARATLPQVLSEKEKDEFILLTHGKQPLPPAYFMVYGEMITQNLALWYFGTWDFKRAAELVQANKNKKRRFNLQKFLNPHKASIQYVKDVMQVTSRVLKYESESPLQTRIGNILHFKNGLTINLSNYDAYVKVPGKKVEGYPVSLFYLKDGELIEKHFSGRQIDGSALLIEKHGIYSAVLADPRLIKSILFRASYLEGKTLQFLTPFIYKESPLTKNYIYVYKINWEAFEKETLEQ